MKISKREKIMLIILAFLIISLGYYHFIYKNQIEKIENLSTKIDEYENIKLIGQIQTSPNNKLYNDFKILNSKTRLITEIYFPSIIQEEIILIIDELIEESNIDVRSISFTNVEKGIVEKAETTITAKEEINVLEEYIKTYEEVSKKLQGKETEEKEEEKEETVEEQISNEVMKITATITFDSDYDRFYRLLGEIERLNRSILINGLNIVRNDDENIKGSISLDFYAVPKFHVQDEEYLNWDIINDYGKDNPFSSFDGYYKRNTNYIRDDVDFKMSVNPITADIPAVIIGKLGDYEAKTYVYGENPNIENVEFEIFKDGKNYYYRYKTQSGAYPKDYEKDKVSFEPKSENVRLVITSSNRVSQSDNSGISLIINNNTDLSMEVEVNNDDKTRPRVNIIKTKGDVLIK